MPPLAEIKQTEFKDQVLGIWKSQIQNCILKLDNSDIRKSNEWLSEVIQNNVMCGDFCRSYELLKAVQEQGNEKKMGAGIENELPILSWCLEVLEGSFTVANSMIRDRSLEEQDDQNLGVNAINDAFMLENAVYFVLKKFLAHRSSIAEIIVLFRRYTFKRHLKARHVFGFDKEKEDKSGISGSFASMLAAAWLKNHTNKEDYFKITIRVTNS